MQYVRRVGLAMTASLTMILHAAAQNEAPAPVTPAKATTAAPVAATINGQPLYEAVLERALERVPPAKRAEARTELLNFFVDNVLIDQYLVGLKVAVEPAEIDQKLDEMRTELKKRNQDFSKMLVEMRTSEAEIREHIAADLRWEKFLTSRCTPEILKQQFEGNKEMFDGSMVRARHILLTPAADDANAVATAKQTLEQVKQQVDAHVAAGLAKLPADADALAKEKARQQLADEAFAAFAKDRSTCPSKAQGGDVGWFQRAGIMVEPFARAAFALKPYTMSDVVQTKFGMHLILLTDRKAGQDVKFEDMKEEVRDYLSERLREAVIAQMRPRSKIEVAKVANP